MPQEESVLRLGRDEALEAARLWQECGDAREFACRVLGGVIVSANLKLTTFANASRRMR